MKNQDNIIIQEKPDWVTWDDIRRCLYEAHAQNRAKGINMTHYLWTAEKIKESLGEHGLMLVALDGKKLVGTAAIADKKSNVWYARGRYAYMCFAGVLPSYNGHGIYKSFIERREKYARNMGFDTLLFDTHSKNTKVQNIARKNGYRFVNYFMAKSGDHSSVVMAKWLRGKSYSYGYCIFRYQISMWKTLVKSFLKKAKAWQRS